MTLDDALLAFYRLQERFEGIPPTMHELAEELGYASKSNAAWWFAALEEAGLIYTPAAFGDRRGNRTLQLSKAGRQRAYLLTDTELRIA